MLQLKHAFNIDQAKKALYIDIDKSRISINLASADANWCVHTVVHRNAGFLNSSIENIIYFCESKQRHMLLHYFQSFNIILELF